MSGKFLKCSLFLFSLILAAGSVFASAEPISQGRFTKEKLYVNGYNLVTYARGEVMGLRAKAVADMFFGKGNLGKAIQYYIEARDALIRLVTARLTPSGG